MSDHVPAHEGATASPAGTSTAANATSAAARRARSALGTPMHVAVVAGPDNGWVAGLTGRGVVVGRGSEADLHLADDLVSRRHLRVRYRAGKVQIRDLGSANGTRRRPVRGSRRRPGGTRGAGGTRNTPATSAGWRRWSRQVRQRWQRVLPGDLLHLGGSTLQIRAHPSLHDHPAPEPARDTESLLPRLLFPLLMSAGMVPILATSQVGLWRLLLMVLMPLGLVAAVAWPALAQRRRRRHHQQQGASGDVSPTTTSHRPGESGEHTSGGRNSPSDPAALILAVQAGLGHTSDMWDLGSGDVTSARPPWLLPRTPGQAARSVDGRWVAPPTRGTGLALVGRDPDVDSLTRYLVCQVASQRTAAWTIVPPPAWTWATWLRPGADAALDGAQPAGTISAGTVPDGTVSDGTVSDGTVSDGTGFDGTGFDGTAPGTLRVLDVRGHAPNPAGGQRGAATRSGPDSGTGDITRPDATASHLVLARHVGQVPPWCTRIIEVRAGHDRQVSPTWAQTVGMLLRASGSTAPAIPPVVRLAQVLGPGGQTQVQQRWQEADDGLAADIGTSARGPVHLDLVRDGPHAVVAGTTGSGKSELLLSWVLSLAARYPPGDLAFLLVDYKGGATFAPVMDLPHALGMLTDLDAATTSRALDSLRAELHRRERLLARAGVANLSEYRATASPHQTGAEAGRVADREPLPRLMVLVDEFRVMSDAHPEHLDALVRLAAQGRSLGIHLVLSTQRPAGAISADMRANLTTRLCLRVLEEVDSADTIGTGAAAALPAIPGRAILRTETTVVFQSAWCGDSEAVRDLVGQIRAAATALLVDEPWRADLPPPWAPPLPEHVRLQDLPAPDLPAVDRPAPDRRDPPGNHPGRALPWLRTDHPDEQRLGVGTLDLPCRVLISGPPGSGRSTAAATIATAALREGIPVHTMADTTLTPADAPALGTSCTDGEVRRAHRLLELLGGRQERSILVIDDVDSWAAALDEVTGPGAGTDMIGDRLRQSRRSGMSVVITAGHTAHRWAAQVDQHLVLAPRDPAAAVMAGVPRELTGSGWPPGRGVLLGGRQAMVCQVATPLRDGACSWPAPADPVTGVAALPDEVDWSDLPPAAGSTTFLWLGVGGDAAQWLGADLPIGSTWLVTGAAGSGRTSVLRLIERQVRLQGRTDVLVIDDADRLDSADLAAIAADLGGRSRTLVAAAHPDRLLSAYHELGGRLREAGTVIALSPVSSHLTGVELRAEFDPGGGAGQGALVDGARVVPLRLARPPT